MILIRLTLITLILCSYANADDNKNIQNAKTIDRLRNETVYVLKCDTITDLKITSFNSTERGCVKNDVPDSITKALSFFTDAKVVNRSTYKYAPYVDCKVQGTLLFNGDNCKWTIRATGTGTIESKKGTIYFVNDVEEFIEDKDIKENEPVYACTHDTITDFAHVEIEYFENKKKCWFDEIDFDRHKAILFFKKVRQISEKPKKTSCYYTGVLNYNCMPAHWKVYADGTAVIIEKENKKQKYFICDDFQKLFKVKGIGKNN